MSALNQGRRLIEGVLNGSITVTANYLDPVHTNAVLDKNRYV